MTPDTSQRDSATITEAARLLGVSVRTVQRRLDNGDLRAIERDGKRFVDMTADATSDAPQGDNVTRHDTTNDARAREESTPDLAALLTQSREEIAFLRSMLEARERDSAELRAALREALKAMPKAIEAGNLEQVRTENEPEHLQHLHCKKEPETGQSGHYKKEQSTPRKVKPWQRAIMRMIGAR
jgi:excisionase family DNA binding protein